MNLKYSLVTEIVVIASMPDRSGITETYSAAVCEFSEFWEKLLLRLDSPAPFTPCGASLLACASAMLMNFLFKLICEVNGASLEE